MLLLNKSQVTITAMRKLCALITITIFVLLLQISPVHLQAQNTKVITNKTIIDLKGAGIGVDAMKSMIVSSKCNFSTEPTDLAKLKKAGVEDEIITAMVEKMSNGGDVTTTAATASTSTASKPSSSSSKSSQTSAATSFTPSGSAVITSLKKEGSGMYYKSETGNVVELEPTVYSSSKKSGSYMQSLTLGIAKTTSKMSVSGPKANIQLKEKKPTFYFVFNLGQDQGINQQTPLWFTNASSPNEFMLVQFLTGKDNKVREVIVGSSNDYVGAASGVDDKQKKSFKYNKLEKGVYEVYFEEDLPVGEYCFMYAGSMSVNGVNNPKVYDFGVK